MKAGASTQALRFPEGFFPTEGFSKQVDDLHARVLVLEDEDRYALLSLEMTSLPADVIGRLAALMREKTGAAHAFVLVTHTFSAPHFLPDAALKDDAQRRRKQELMALVEQAAGKAAQEAADSLREVRPALGESRCGVCTNRDVQTPEGWWVSCGGDGPTNEAMTVLALEDESGRPAAVLVHYAVQSSVLDGAQLRSGGKAVSGDLAGRMARELEDKLGAPVLFVLGAAGDQAPRRKAVTLNVESGGAISSSDMQDDAIPVCAELAHEMAEAALAALDNRRPMASGAVSCASCTVTVPAKKMKGLHELHPTRTLAYEPDGQSEQTVELLCVGELQIIGVRPELNCVTAGQITQGCPMARVATMWNGAAKYMADTDAYDRVTYEAQNSPFGRGAAERLVDAARGLLRQAR